MAILQHFALSIQTASLCPDRFAIGLQKHQISGLSGAVCMADQLKAIAPGIAHLLCVNHGLALPGLRDPFQRLQASVRVPAIA